MGGEAEMLHVMRRLDGRGDGEIATWSEDDPESVKIAAAVFNKHLADPRHYVMYDISRCGNGGELGVRLEEFDPAVPEILAHPQLVMG
jgi:hypothetical protein